MEQFLKENSTDFSTSFYKCRWLTNGASHSRLTAGMTDLKIDHHNLVNEYYDIIYILKGSGTYIDENGYQSRYGEGTVYQRIPGKPHSTLTDPGTESLQAFFSMPSYCWTDLVNKGIVDGTQALLKPGIDKRLLEIFISVSRSLDKPAEYSLQYALNRMELFLIEAGRLEQPSAKEISPKLEACAERLSNPDSIRLSIEQIAEENGIGYELFRKQFRNRFGISPHLFRIQRRVERGAALLKTTDMPIEQIAAYLGYADRFSFSKQFKKHAGISPRLFREGC